MANERRQQQVAKRIQQKISELLLHDIRDPRATFVTITRVTISQDLAKAKVYWSVLEERHRSKVTHMFEHAKVYFRTSVARDINIRSAPLLEFHFDEGMMAAERIEQVLRRVLPPEDRTIGELPATSAEKPKSESVSPWPTRQGQSDD